jgi:hypothetical protein
LTSPEVDGKAVNSRSDLLLLRKEHLGRMPSPARPYPGARGVGAKGVAAPLRKYTDLSRLAERLEELAGASGSMSAQ